MKKEANNKKTTSRRTAKKESKEVSELREALADTIGDLQRVQADFANFKKRSDEDLARRQLIGQRQMVAMMLPTIDNIERALTHVPKDLTGNSWAQGVKNTAEQLVESLSKLGIEKIKTVGEHFEPEYMEAVQIIEGEGQNEIVDEEIQSGYMMNGELIRHAMVRVRREV